MSAVTSDYASDVEELLGVRKAMLLIPVAIAASYVLAGLVPLLVFPMFFVMKGGNSLVGPITNRYINDQVESVGRATLLSSVAMLRNVAGVPFRVGSGILATWYTSMTAVAILGAIFLVLAFVLWSVASPVSADYEPPDSGNTTADAAED
ncbi:hypothetical protein ABSL23_01655 [Halobacterium sp. NMX12-1]|uniref:MFS transporter n=1 Tax=Halobacterium sp. NMX12-1 TaxID=3166650 RepID=A0AAU8CC94_9EURY